MTARNATGTGAERSRDERTQPRTQKITTFLWFDNNAEEAVNFYVSTFKKSKVLNSIRYGDAGPGPKGTIMTIAFQLDGQEFTALNGGPQFKFNEAVSLVVHCETQEEVDYFWERLSEGGQKVECGWLKDKFGLSWQIVPDVLLELLQDSDSQKAERVMKAMLQMKKLDIEGLKQAAKGR
jgi:predicted 3-demethylubiquinone-9 3-methyltransferase (glyoxalase superfamily)